MLKEEIIGIMGAMEEEVKEILNLMSSTQKQTIGGREYYNGLIGNKKVVVVFSRWGKVAAAATAAALIYHFHITQLLFTGVAGAIDRHLQQGDVVIGETLFQHDLDARPFFQQFEIPLLQKSGISPSADEVNIAYERLKKLFQSKAIQDSVSTNILNAFYITQPIVRKGIIASGDCFFESLKQKNELTHKLPNVLCVEMEGAAVAQVCYENGIPFLVIRIISDTADEKAAGDFQTFIEQIAGKFSQLIVKELLINA
jgi:adenosylhomocysteine nucleosidase